MTAKTLKLWLASFLLLLAACNGPAKPLTAEKEYMFWPPTPDNPRIQFLTSLSSTADITKRQDQMSNFLYGEDSIKDQPFQRPFGIRMFGGCIYVCDASASAVAVLDFRKKEVRLIGQSGQVHLIMPIDVAVAPDGIKYVADTGHGAVLVYDATDRYAGRISVKDLRPVSLAVREDELYIADLAGSKVRVFNRFNGAELRTIGEKGGDDGQFGGTMGLALDPKGNLYVNDVIGCRVQKLSPEGKFIWAIGAKGGGDHPGQFVRPKLQTMDSDNILYVVDFAFQNVQMFDTEGHLLNYFGGVGNFPGAMDGPTGICTSDADLDLFAQYVHPAFQAQRLIFVTNNIGPKKINVYALGNLKPGKTIADISAGRVKGVFGFSEGNKDSAQIDLTTQPATAPADAATQPTTAPANAPASAPATRPTPAAPGQVPF